MTEDLSRVVAFPQQMHEAYLGILGEQLHVGATALEASLELGFVLNDNVIFGSVNDTVDRGGNGVVGGLVGHDQVCVVIGERESIQRRSPEV